MNRIMQAVALALVLGTLAVACSSSGTGDNAAGVPPDLRILVGQGGGFSGLWSGYALNAGDSVFRCNGRLPGENPVWVGLIPHDSLRALWRSIDVLSLLDSASADARANLVHMIAIRAHGRERSFSWVEHAPAGVAPPVLALNARIQGLLAQSLHN
jgi:hypothetical protein